MVCSVSAGDDEEEASLKNYMVSQEFSSGYDVVYSEGASPQTHRKPNSEIWEKAPCTTSVE